MISNRAQMVPPSPTITISTKAKKMMAEGINVINFGVGEPDFNTPEYIKEAAIRAIHNNFTRYTENKGIVELREAIKRKFKKDNNLDYSAEAILVSPGAKASLINIIMAICDPNDKVLLPSPYWVSYTSQVIIAGGIPVIIDTKEENEFKIKAEQISRAVEVHGEIKAIMLNSPNNPTGSVYTEAELLAIGKVCVENDIIIISDEIYEKLIYDNTKHVSIASLSPEIFERSIVINGVSKAYAMTGWRLGYCAGPIEIMKAAGRIQEHATSNVNSITQKASVAALTEDDGSIEHMRKEFENRRNHLVKGLREIDHVTCTMPQGAFYALPNVSYYLANNKKGIKNGDELCLYLLDNYHIALVSGLSFGLEGYVRFSYANSMENLIEGCERFAKGLASLL